MDEPITSFTLKVKLEAVAKAVFVTLMFNIVL